MKKMIILSLDAMISEDLAYLETTPHLGPIIQRGTKVLASETVYPSLTYTAHASMISGTYPDKHGIINNEQFNPLVKFGDWYEKRDMIQVPILPELCEQHGYTVAINSWPTMVGADVTYNLQRAGIHQVKEDKKQAMRDNSTPGLMDELWAYCSDAWKMDKYYDSDKFSGLASKYLIENYEPDVIFMHMTLIDHYRHVYGVYSDKIKQAIDYIDEMIGYVTEALKAKGLYDETTFVICSDHGQIDIEKSININKDFIDKGWITCDAKGNVTDWEVFAHSAAASAQIYIKNKTPERIKEVATYLEDNKERFHIASLFDAETLKEDHHLAGDFSFVIEAKAGSGFNYQLDAPFEKDVQNEDYRTSVGTHGHLPTKGSQPALVISGAGIPQGQTIAYARNIDIAPTCARLLGFEMKHVDGKVIEAITQ